MARAFDVILGCTWHTNVLDLIYVSRSYGYEGRPGASQIKSNLVHVRGQIALLNVVLYEQKQTEYDDDTLIFRLQVIKKKNQQNCEHLNALLVHGRNCF